MIPLIVVVDDTFRCFDTIIVYDNKNYRFSCCFVDTIIVVLLILISKAEAVLVVFV